ncbi:MAG: PQQ-binding-like beta-propeller repeat protein [Armatimonadetes bacterium]|nr:PQQ-binding-like beta-propeller repeat protein [Armatimonadota bacterium]
MKALPFFLAGVSLCSAAFAQLDPQSPWPTANHDHQNTSRAPFIGPQSLKVRWEFKAGGIMWGPVVGRDGTLYAPSNDGFLYAINPDGSQKWTFPLENGKAAPGQHAVIGSDGTIYATGSSLFAVTPDGKEKWRFAAPGLGGFQAPTIGPDGLVYQTSTDGTVYALDAQTGEKRWSKQITPGVRNQAPISFTKDGDPIVSVRKGGIPNVFRLDKQGNVKWSFTGPDEMRSATVGDDGTLFVASKVGSLFALNPDTGEVKWKQDVRNAAEAIMEFPALGLDGSVLQGSGEGEFGAYAPDGSTLWKFQTDENTTRVDPVTNVKLTSHMGTAIVDATGTAYVPSPEADLWMISKDGKLLNRFEVPALFTRMAMGADGTLYSGSLAGSLYAFGEDFMLGDGNEDKKVDVADAIIALQSSVGMIPTSPMMVRCLDVAQSGVSGRPFGDGTVNVNDAITILKQSIMPQSNFPYIQ